MIRKTHIFQLSLSIAAIGFQLHETERTSFADSAATSITSFRSLDPPSAQPSHFGWSMDSFNGKVLVGGFDGYSYIYDVATGHELNRLRGSDTQRNDTFGRSVALSGDYALVGANGAQAAYVFDASTGAQVRKFADPNGPPVFGGFGFGVSAALSGDTAVVGDLGDDTKGTDAGAVYIYSVSTGQLQHTFFTPDFFTTTEEFGAAVDIEGNTLVVGAPGANGGDLHSGAVFVCNATTGQVLHTLAPDESGPSFGNKVVISGNLLLVGQPKLSGHGAVYLFDLNTGQQLRKFTAPNPNSDNEFGAAIAFDGRRALIGDWSEQVNGNYEVGGAYLYDVSSGNLLASLLPQELHSFGDDFGFSVALDGSSMLSSSLGGAGNVYVATLPAGDYNSNGIVDAADYTVWRDSLGLTGIGLAADGNGNGMIDSGDYDVWQANFGKTAGNGVGSAATADVPEPSTAALLVIGCIVALVARRR
jgi:FG-GAP repeat